MRLLLLALALGAAHLTPLRAKEFNAQWVEAVNNDIRCTKAEVGWLFNTMGPCRNFKAPDTVAVGERFSADGTLRTIRVIIATQSEIDYRVDDWEVKKGEWWCRAAENLNDLNQSSGTRTWLLIRKCIPVR